MDKFKCNKCEKEYDTLKGLSNHRFQKHNIKPKDTYDEYVLKNKPKLCECGCGEEPTFLSITKGYNNFIKLSVKPTHLQWVGCKLIH